MLTIHLGGDFGVLDWKFQNFWNFFVGGGKWMTVFCIAETEVLIIMLNEFEPSSIKCQK
jgi:hypothetical protein